jgi:hypothetical protein
VPHQLERQIRDEEVSAAQFAIFALELGITRIYRDGPKFDPFEYIAHQCHQQILCLAARRST